MKSMLQKFTSVSKSGMRKEVKQSSVEKGYIGDGDENEGNNEGDGGNNGNDGNGGYGGVKDGIKEEKAEKEGVRQCLSSKCLVEQLPNTLSVSFKGKLLMLYFLLP